MTKGRALVFCACMLAALSARAGASLYDQSQLKLALKVSPPCCVIDGRTEGQRQAHPLEAALVWSKDLRLEPTGAVVVVADDDQTALSIARRIEVRFHARKVLAVKGGVATWEAVGSTVENSGLPASFVIPMNTCEQGKPLQTLRSEKH